MSKDRTRRETLRFMGAVGITALVGCSGQDTISGGTAGTGGTGGSGGGGAGGSSGSGGSSGVGGANGGGAAGATGGGSGAAGRGGNGGTAGTSPDAGAAGRGGSGGSAGGGTDSGAGGGSGGQAGGGVDGSPAGGSGGSAGSGAGGTGGGGSGGTGVDGGASDAGLDGTSRDASGDPGSDTGPVQCKAKQETTVGPYPNINLLERRDVRGNSQGTTTPKQGVELTLRIGVYDLDNGCAPISDAFVDIWQCDAVGDYAGYSAFNTTGQDYCRGYLKTNAQGVVEFLTIFPGSYTGRAIHIHLAIQGSAKRLNPNDEGTNLPNAHVAQLYFAKTVADDVFNSMPIYKMGAAITPNESDGIYTGNGGKDLVVKMTKTGSGYVGEVEIGVKRSQIGK